MVNEFMLIRTNSYYGFILVFFILSAGILFGSENEVYGLLYTFKKPKISKKYDKEYEQEIYSYEILFRAMSINKDEDVNIEEFEYNSTIFTGGDVWQGRFKEDDIKKTLKSGESVKGNILIDVVPNPEIKKELYDIYDFYYISDQGNVIFKNKYK